MGIVSSEEAAVRCPLRSKEDDVEKNESIDSSAQHGLFLGADDAQMVGYFAVGPSGCRRQQKSDQLSAVASSDQCKAGGPEDLVRSLPSEGLSGAVV